MRFSTALCSALVAAAGMLSVVPAARADDTGVAVIHQWYRVGHKTCLLEHYHDGAGTAQTKKQAIASAEQAWRDFTAFEYGSDWGSYRLAEHKRASCDGAGSGYTCHVEGIPCRAR